MNGRSVALQLLDVSKHMVDQDEALVWSRNWAQQGLLAIDNGSKVLAAWLAFISSGNLAGHQSINRRVREFVAYPVAIQPSTQHPGTLVQPW
ncbi:uncharacterized protein EKO05_0005920 [Ascochyta rabiei]|uniref:Uncharacterized protein n=1 Tax=Didymella rabiei TaxID=5454 RepID=A0A163JLK1_DIDRA|nr:uncharacterized protein EKO05_0005920 [Ascochyta rabiei]KZM26441.1 hypothetical protein ST47_g2422 [Ascochyta rabiei]UPX15474.1 hypothetical protein EKO05_0005920 [Ascochyta rabiei]